MYTNEIQAYRSAFYNAWQKYKNHQPLEAFEYQLINVIEQHPEYHALLSQAPKETQSYTLEENPFFHLSLHLAILDQIKLNRPDGVKIIYDNLVKMLVDTHEVTHKMMACLAEVMWEAQKNGNTPDEDKYLQKLKEILEKNI